MLLFFSLIFRNKYFAEAALNIFFQQGNFVNFFIASGPGISFKSLHLIRGAKTFTRVAYKSEFLKPAVNLEPTRDRSLSTPTNCIGAV